MVENPISVSPTQELINQIDQSIRLLNQALGIDFDPSMILLPTESAEGNSDRSGEDDGRTETPILAHYRQDTDRLVPRNDHRGTDSLSTASRESWKQVRQWELADQSQLTLFITPNGIVEERIYPNGRRSIGKITPHP